MSVKKSAINKLLYVYFPCIPHSLHDLKHKIQGMVERGSWTKGWRGGGLAEGQKKIVTSPILMVEVVVDVPKGTSDGSPGVQDVFKLL